MNFSTFALLAVLVGLVVAPPPPPKPEPFDSNQIAKDAEKLRQKELIKLAEKATAELKKAQEEAAKKARGS
jgi:hypothetical protein